MLTLDSTVGDILGHPAFAGFAHLLLPWNERVEDKGLALRNVGSLMPYHGHVAPGPVVAALNRMIAEAGGGVDVFHDFYSEADKSQQTARRNTGLFFFPGKAGAPFALIAPGGGFAYVGALHEGFPLAHEISLKGYNAFVLRYRAGQGGGVATEDMAAALSWIARNAERLGVTREGYSLWGGSAGARMAAAIGSHGSAYFGGDALPRAAAVVMLYTGHSDIGASEPSTFVAVGENDGIASPATMERRVAALRKAGVKVEYHKYPRVGHGFGLGVGTSAEGWISEAVRFWTEELRRTKT